jgi:hypothetical protein
MPTVLLVDRLRSRSTLPRTIVEIAGATVLASGTFAVLLARYADNARHDLGYLGAWVLLSHELLKVLPGLDVQTLFKLKDPTISDGASYRWIILSYRLLVIFALGTIVAKTLDWMLSGRLSRTPEPLHNDWPARGG